MSSLPIDSLQPEFLSLLTQHHVIVEAETGSGKSTRLPIWASSLGRVLVIEPRRIACTSLALYLADEAQQEVGKSVGYAIKLETRFNQETPVVFVTPGVALRWFSENQLSDFDIIIVDEFHERRWDIDLLVAILKQTRQHKLVITSATIDGTKLAQYLDAKRIKSKGRNYDVSVIFRSRDSKQLPDVRGIEARVKDEVMKLVSCKGDILVFLPGRKEIAQCQSALSDIEDIISIPLHASVTEQERCLALNIQPFKKVVLATNVAETSLTIPNVVAVIDSGLERRTEQRNGRTTLSLKHISRASAKQRSGRAGRVMEGYCVRLYGEFAALADKTPPEMHREALTEAMLASASCGFALSKLSFLEPLPIKSVEQAKFQLIKMGAIDNSEKVTAHGKKIYPLPIDTLYADLVTRMPSKPLQEAMIDLTAAIATPGKLYRLSSSEEVRERLGQEEPFGCDANLNIQLIRGKTFSGVTVDLDVLREVRALAAQMREVFELPQLTVASRYDHKKLILNIAQLHPELVFVRREKRREAMANGDMEVTLGREHRFKESDEAALVLNTHSLPGRGVKQTLNLATFIAPISLTNIAEHGFGTWLEGETREIEHQTFVEMKLVYAGRTIAKKNELAKGDLAIKPLLGKVMNNTILPGFFEQRHQEIEHWKLYILLENNEVSDLNFETWFTEQLKLLDISDPDDLELFSAEDFGFDGIPYWQYEDFAQTFPFRLALGDLNLDVEYFARKKLIQVVYRDGLRKGYPKRWELPKWQGWRIQYKKNSKIIDIK